jgi:hypothetical protein
VVPTTARTAVVPVVTALLRSTDSAPSTTQGAFGTGKMKVTVTASASARPVRRLLSTVIERVLRYPPSAANVVRLDATRSAIPVSGSFRPSSLAHTGRPSAAAE